jgi:DNA-binding transcriptional LysR family regulator
MFDWNDIKAFLAVARGGSTLAAAKALGVNQTTAARRIEALEAALGLKLFERGQTGSRLTDAGRDLMVQGEKIEQAAGAFATHAQAHQRGLSGVIKITATEVVANTSVTPAIGAFRRLYPDLQINLVISDKMLDIESGEADLAIRSGIEMPISDLVARKICDYEFALYCNRDYASRRGVPASPAELADHDLVGADGAAGDLPGMRWMFSHGGGAAPATRSNSMTNLVHTVRAGLGVAPLPCLLADADPTLIRCSEPIAEAQSHSWIVTRRELKDTPRIRAFMDFLVPFMQDDVRAREARNREIQAEAEAAAAPAAQPKVSSPA